MNINVSTDPFMHTHYLVRKQVLKLFGGTFRIFDPCGSLALIAEMKAFKLKEDIRVYTEETKTNEVLTIKARNILDISATYDVLDSKTEDKLGALRRRGLKSIFKDEWLILDKLDNEIGTIKEDGLGLALLRRLLAECAFNPIPQKFIGEINNTTVFAFKQNFNPFVSKIDLDYSMDLRNLLDRRLGIAAAVLLCGIEGKQRG